MNDELPNESQPDQSNSTELQSPPPASQPGTPSAEIQPQGPPQHYAPRPPKDRSIAIILEILPGLFGILGIGWIYAENTAVGILIPRPLLALERLRYPSGCLVGRLFPVHSHSL